MRRRTWITALKIAIATVVAYFIWRTVAGAREQLARQGGSWRAPELGWLVVAALFYLAGLFPMAVYWRVLLGAMGQPSRWLEAMTAYYVGHLGKYVPGKAMVVVLRVALVRSEGMGRLSLAVSVVAETLTMMSVGAFLAALVLLTQLAEHPRMVGLALALAVVAAVPTWPPIFRRLVARSQAGAAQDPSIALMLGRLNHRLLSLGWLANGVGWTFLGASLGAVVKSIEPERTWGELAGQLPVHIATAALAIVAGFLSLLPGGVGVREWVASELLADSMGPLGAITAALVLRIVWLASELLAAIILLALGRLVR